MEVFELWRAANDWGGLYTVHGETDRFNPLDGSSMAAGWEAVEVAWDEEPGRPRPDFSWVSTAPVFTGRAVEALGDLLEGRGELLPLAVTDGSEAYAFNVTRLSEALDVERSELDYYRSGGIMDVDRYVFDPATVARETIFKLAILPRSYEYVTDRFRARVEEAGLTGFRWKPPVWSGG